jgi:hypothetical protein
LKEKDDVELYVDVRLNVDVELNADVELELKLGVILGVIQTG